MKLVKGESRMDLVEIVQEAQAARGISDAELCRLLGIDQSLWSRVKSREYEPSKQFILAAMANLPEKRLEIAQWQVEAGRKCKRPAVNDLSFNGQ